MLSVRFLARGHRNVLGTHRTTLEITTEDFLTESGTCIVGIRADQTLANLPEQIKALATSGSTSIVLRLTVEDSVEEIWGHGAPGLAYEDTTSMVVRTSSYECGRTLMVGADKAARDLDRSFVDLLQDNRTRILCDIDYING
jgi:hypothetical protein